MDMRNSKESLLEKVKELEKRLDAVYEAGQWGISHVGAANYAHRCEEAEEKLENARFCAAPLENSVMHK